ncbi:MAG: hypothetical protein V1781_04235 [Bacteroidota bacterium]
MKYSTFCILLFALCILPSFSYSQTIKAFSTDSVKFLDEMDDYFSAVKGREKEGHEFVKEELKPFWFGGKISLDKRQFVYATCKSMIQKKMRPFPDYYNFFLSLINFHKTNQPESSFLSWKASIEKLIWSASTKKLSDFLYVSNILFGENKLYKTNSVEWFAGNNNYIFDYDSLPKIVFSTTNLFCAVKADTAIIYGTQGICYPTENKWIGKGGKVNWARAGINENMVFAEIKNYSADLTKQSYKADSVVFTNKLYFKNTLLGVLEEKAVPDAKPETAAYPRFESYSTRFEISNIAQGKVDFAGGFALRGSKFIGTGSQKEDATLIFKRNNKPLVKASGKTFIFRNDRITSEDAAIIMYLDKDSIYHPSIMVRFDIEKKELILIRTLEGISKTPYFNSFHKMDMHIEEIDWTLDSAKMDIKTLIGSSQGITDFISSDYFRTSLYYELQGIDPFNPLVMLRECGKKIGKNKFTGEEFARFRKMDPNSIRPSLIPIANGGFIVYNTKKDEIILQERLFQHLKAKAGTTDYDVLTIRSDVKGGTINAVLNLMNYNLRIFGIREIFLSDSQSVSIYPKNGTIVLKKNRDFDFGGVVDAGRFTFFGKKFFFNYDKFKVDIHMADSLRFTVRRLTADAFGNYPEVLVKSVIEQIEGELLIDNTGNRSGRKHYAQYPIFNSDEKSFVYYDKRSVQRGVYHRDKFYFNIDPYSLDSLDDFSTEGLRLKGTLASAGIFPDFKDTLYVQPDYSLGFIRPTPPDGFAVYGDKGRFNNKIRLSNEGIRGDGTLDFLTSHMVSKDLIFFPDSVNATAQNFEIKEQKKGKLEYPPVKGDSVYTHWMPKKEWMQIYTVNNPLDFYNGQAQMKGRIDYTSKALSGNGKIEFAGAVLAADFIKFQNKKFTSDTAMFSLKALETSQFSFSTKNVNAIVDFENRTGDFASNGKGTVVSFPINQYICYMDNFKWFMDKGDIELSSRDANKPKDERMLELSGPEFISIHRKQDSLRFNAPRARFDYKKYIITARDVAWINVADARIYPDSGKVVILKDAEMKTFSNAKIVANSITAYHSIYNTNVNVFSRKSYVASGYYDYMDEIRNKQTIYLENIRVDTTYQTIAEAVIVDTVHFTLSPNYEFNGKINLFSNDQYLTFTGICQIRHICEELPKTWFKFSSPINPEKILIPITENMVDNKKDNLGSSIMLAADTNGIYTSFLTKKLRKTDKEVLQAIGYLFFDKTTQEYKIASKEKLNEPALTGNYLSFRTNSCRVYGEGKMGSLGLDLGQIKLDVVGNASHNLIIDSASFKLMMAIDFFFEHSALEKMVDFIMNIQGLTGVSVDLAYEKGLHEILGKDKADKLIADLNLYGKFKKFPDELEHTFFLTDVKMVWDKKNNAYVSTGAIGIGIINRNQINKYVAGTIALSKKRTGDILDIYLEADKNIWYYFRYTKGMLTAVSSESNFNKTIQELKSDKREQKVEKGQQSFHFAIGSEQQKKLFIRKFQNDE